MSNRFLFGQLFDTNVNAERFKQTPSINIQFLQLKIALCLQIWEKEKEETGKKMAQANMHKEFSPYLLEKGIFI
ncbi:MAG: hypothetical protein AAF655_08310 [Bacteroidota bacterium]